MVQDTTGLGLLLPDAVPQLNIPEATPVAGPLVEQVKELSLQLFNTFSNFPDLNNHLTNRHTSPRLVFHGSRFTSRSRSALLDGIRHLKDPAYSFQVNSDTSHALVDEVKGRATVWLKASISGYREEVDGRIGWEWVGKLEWRWGGSLGKGKVGTVGKGRWVCVRISGISGNGEYGEFV